MLCTMCKVTTNVDSWYRTVSNWMPKNQIYADL